MNSLGQEQAKREAGGLAAAGAGAHDDALYRRSSSSPLRPLTGPDVVSVSEGLGL